MRRSSDGSAAKPPCNAFSSRLRGRLAGAVLAASIAARAAAQVVPDGSLGPADPLPGPDYVIPAEIGRQNGSNLFHSFGTFDVATGESATFTDQGATAPIHNVLARVTGGETSDIDGALGSTIPGADLYLMNPSGILFGPHAELEVQGSFHATSADFLEFPTLESPNGERFEARPGGAVPLLAVAAPTAFGFLDAPAPLAVDQAMLLVPEGERLSLVGGDLTIRGDSTATPDLRAAGGRIDLVSLASAGRVEVAERAEDPPAVEASGDLGRIHLQGGWVTTRGDGGGELFIRAGALVLEEASQIDSTTLGAGGDAPGLLDVEVHTLEARGGSNLSASTGRSGDAGTARIVGRQVTLSDGSAARATAFEGATGNAGRVEIAADEFRLLEGAVLEAATYETESHAGTVSVHAGDVLVEGGNIVADSEANADAGTIDITATGEVRIAGGSSLRARALEGGRSGEIAIVADRLELDGSIIFVNTGETGPGGTAGSVSVTARSHVLLDTSVIGAQSLIGPEPDRPDEVGRIVIRAPEIQILGGSDLRATTGGSGKAGSVEIEAGHLRLEGGSNVIGTTISVGSFLESEASGDAGEAPGSAGRIFIRAARVEILGRSSLEAHTLGGGSAGSIEVDAGQVLLDGGGFISASSFSTSGQSGGAGKIVIEAEDLEIGPGSAVGVDTWGGGSAGSIAIRAQELLLDGGDILARTEPGSSGAAGRVDIEAGRVVLNRARVHARTRGSGSAGTVSIRASESLLVTGGLERQSNIDASGGSFDGGEVRLSAPDVTLEENSFVKVSARGGTGAAGSVLIAGDRILLRSGGFVDATAIAFLGGNPSAGSITLIASESVQISNQGGVDLSIPRFDHDLVPSGVYADALLATGSTGSISISAPLVQVVDGGIVATASLAADGAGDIEISGDRIEILRGGLVDTSSELSGDAGTLTLDASSLVLVAGEGADGAPSRIRSATAGSGVGGEIVVSAPDVVLDGGAVATTTVGAGSAGAAGEIRILADRIGLVNGGRIDASSVSGGPGGSVAVVADEVIRIQGATSGIFGQAAGAQAGGSLLLSAPAIEIVGGNVSSESSPELEGIEPIFRDAVKAGLLLPLAIPPEGVTGAAGDVEIRADVVRLAGGAVTTETRSSGEAGRVALHVGRLELSEGGAIRASTLGAGAGGEVVIDVDRLRMSGGSSISARSSGPSDAGSIEILDARRIELVDSAITTEASEASGGNILVDVGDRLELRRSALTASVGSGDGGNVTLSPGFVILDQGLVLATADERDGRGGNIAITTEGLIASTGSAIDATSRLGIDGTVNVQSPDTDVAGELAPLPEPPEDATGLLRTRCALRRADQDAGRFLVLGRDGAPTTVPDGYLLASFPSAGHPAGRPKARATATMPVTLASLYDSCR